MKKVFLVLAAAALLLPCLSWGQTRTRPRTYTIHHRGGIQYVTTYSQKHSNHGRRVNGTLARRYRSSNRTLWTNNGRRVHGAYAHTYNGPAYAGAIGSRAWRLRHRTGQSSTLRRTYLTRTRSYDYDRDNDNDNDRDYRRHHSTSHKSHKKHHTSHSSDRDDDDRNRDRDDDMDRDRDHDRGHAKEHHDNGLHLGQRKHGKGD